MADGKDNVLLRKLAVGTFIFILLMVADARALDPENHHHVTRVSEAVYLDCLAQMGFENSLKDGMEAIVMFSGEEDVSPVLRRIFNWHFFDAYDGDEANAMGRHLSGARMSLHHIFDRHAEDLADAISNNRKDEIYELTGRILHYIQDMNVPAHVAPIFHYKFWIFDRSDYFDGMPEWKMNTVATAPRTCSFDSGEAVDLKKNLNLLLDRTARATRNRIREQIPVPENHLLSGKTWEEFWILRDPEHDEDYGGTIEGFAPYGTQGAGGFERLCRGSASDRQACLGFFVGSYQNAVSSTVETLLMVNALVQQD